MKRILRRAASVVTIVLVPAIALLWLRSYGHQDQCGWWHGQQGRSIYTFPGGVTYRRWLDRTRTPDQMEQPRFRSFEYGAPAGIGNATYARPSHDWTNLGFRYEHKQWLWEMQTSGNWTGIAGRPITTGDPAYQSAPNLVDERSISVPLWPALALLLWAPAIKGWRRVRSFRRGRRRALSGRCPHCGYDLRAAKDRCPECGAAVVIVRIVESSDKVASQ